MMYLGFLVFTILFIWVEKERILNKEKAKNAEAKWILEKEETVRLAQLASERRRSLSDRDSELLQATTQFDRLTKEYQQAFQQMKAEEDLLQDEVDGLKMKLAKIKELVS